MKKYILMAFIVALLEMMVWPCYAERINLNLSLPNEFSATYKSNSVCNNGNKKTKTITNENISGLRYDYQYYVGSLIQKIESFANRQYMPEKLKHQQSNQEAVVELVIYKDGTLCSYSFNRFNGSPEYKKMIEDIINMVMPFSKFPESISEEIDVIHVVRYWLYLKPETK